MISILGRVRCVSVCLCEQMDGLLRADIPRKFGGSSQAQGDERVAGSIRFKRTSQSRLD